MSLWQILHHLYSVFENLSIKTGRFVAPETRGPCCCCLQWAGPQPPLPLSPKNLYLLHDAWKHTVFSYNFTWPLTPSAQMQYDLAATIHFGLWSRFNEFLLCCMCMSLGLALFFWSSSPPICLGNASLGAPKRKMLSHCKREIFSLVLCLWIWYSEVGSILHSKKKINTYWVCLFVFYFKWQFQ